MRPITFAATISLAFITSVHAGQPVRTPRVEMTVLGSFPGAQWTMPAAINNRGDVVGSASVEGVTVAFIWTRRGGFELIAEHASAFDINDRGDVVGLWQTCAQDCPTHGFIWNVRDGFRDLGPQFFSASINNRGDMAGDCHPDGDLVPCRIRGGVLEIATCEGTCVGGSAASINARGEVVGFFDDAGTFTNAFLWRRDGSQITLPPGPPAPNAALVAAAWDINNRGFVVGTSGAGTAALWTKNGLLTLDTVGTSVATGINARGWVVGIGDNRSRAFFWDPARGMFVFLSDDPSQAHDVNDRGEVAGWIGHFIREAVIWRVRP